MNLLDFLTSRMYNKYSSLMMNADKNECTQFLETIDFTTFLVDVRMNEEKWLCMFRGQNAVVWVSKCGHKKRAEGISPRLFS